MSPSFRAESTADFRSAYKEGRSTPEAVAHKVLQATKASEDLNPPLRVFIAQQEEDLLEQARASADRWARGAPMGPLDGVPVAVKDELDQLGYPTTVGTSFQGQEPATQDATSVDRLRKAGAMLIGKTNMQEIGLGVTGINPHHGAVRNPHNTGHATGGSSSGSGAAVAAGLCPIAVGADGGGSVRIPAAICGVVGFKPTFGRVSEHGAAPVCWSVAHIGPLATNVQDTALALELMAGPDRADPNSWAQPALELGDLEGGVQGLRVGWSEEWAKQADPEVMAASRAAVARLEEAGARLVRLDPPDTDLIRVVLSITIGVEMAASQYEHWNQDKRRYGADTRALLQLANEVPAVDYVRAQRFRVVIADQFAAMLEAVDVIATPATAATAPPIHDDALAHGQSDDLSLEQMTAFSYAANLTGHPALTVPAGYDSAGLPVGLQLMGQHWGEATLLRCGRVVERGHVGKEPETHYRLLP